MELRNSHRGASVESLEGARGWRHDQALLLRNAIRRKAKKGEAYAFLADGNFRAVDGEILDIDPEKRLVISWSAHWDEASGKDKPSRVTYELSSPTPGTTKLQLRHDDFAGETATYKSSVGSWPMMMSSLKSLIETGKPLPTPPMG